MNAAPDFTAAFIEKPETGATLRRDRPSATSEAPEQGEYFLWRLMIDQRFQNRGYGRRAVQLLIERIRRSSNPRALITSHLKVDANSGRFYERMGFEFSRSLHGTDEIEMMLTF